jgi:hypothetical protein
LKPYFYLYRLKQRLQIADGTDGRLLLLIIAFIFYGQLSRIIRFLQSLDDPIFSQLKRDVFRLPPVNYQILISFYKIFKLALRFQVQYRLWTLAHLILLQPFNLNKNGGFDNGRQ